MGQIEPRIRLRIERAPPPLLVEEAKAFAEFHRNKLTTEELPHLLPRVLRRHLGRDRVSAVWSFSTTRRKTVELIFREYGMLADSYKNERFLAQFETFQDVAGGKLAKQEQALICRVNFLYPALMPRSFFLRRMKEHFPEADWIKERRKMALVFPNSVDQRG